MSEPDPALPLFREAAEAEGITLGAWAKKYGIVLPRRHEDIDRHELDGGTLGGHTVDGDEHGHCPSCRRRGDIRRRERD